MTLLAEPSAQPAPPDAENEPASQATEKPSPSGPAPFTPARIAAVALAWLGVTLAVVFLVLYGVGPLLQQRDQSQLLDEYRVEVRQTANQTQGFAGVEKPTQAPSAGDPVGILEINGLELRQVVVEDVGPQETRRGPGHAPGTAGIGQPGNSVVVGRRSMFAGPFRTLADLEKGDRIVATTTQGKSLYVVRAVREVTISEPDPDAAPAPPAEPTDGDPEPMALTSRMTTERLYGPTPTDQLTLITSASAKPWATDKAQVVVADLTGARPFEPTPQGGRTSAADGRHADLGAWAILVLALLAYAAAAVGATWLYRHARLRSAWLLTAPVLVALAFVLAESIARILPAWA